MPRWLLVFLILFVGFILLSMAAFITLPWIANQSAQAVFDFRMAWNGRLFSVGRVDIEVVPLPMTVEPASGILQVLNEFAAIQTWTSISLV